MAEIVHLSERSDSLRALAGFLDYARDEACALDLLFLSHLLTMARVELARALPKEPTYEPIIVNPVDQEDATFCNEEEEPG